MKTHRKPLVIAVATALGTLGTLPVQAIDLVYTESFNIGPVSIFDTCGAVNATSCNNGSTSVSPLPATLASPTLSQFDSSNGVLMGTTIELNSTRTQTISGSLDNGTKNKTTTTGSGKSNAQIAVPGVSEDLDAINLTSSAKVPNTTGATTASFSTSTNTVTDTILTIPDANLDSYIGSSTIIANLTTTVFEVNSTWSNGNKNSTTSKATYRLDWEGDLTITYDYLLHSAPSFDGSSSMLTLDLDFGTVFLGDIVPDLGFSLYNPVGERVGLDLDNFNGSGNTAKLTTNLSAFSALTAGLSQNFLASFNTSNLGVYSASYTLNLSDANVGAASSRFNYQMILNLTGSVIERPIPVPEPGALTLLGIGLLGLPFARRRRR